MKKLFIGLFTIIGFGFTSFGYCEVVEDLVSYIGGTNTVSINGNSYYTILDLGSSGNPGTYCVYISAREGGNNLRFGFNSSLSRNNEMSYSLYSWWGTPLYACLYVDTQYMFFYNATSQNISLTYKVFKLNALMNTNLPIFTSQECQSEYNLIPISSVDTNYCQINNLCPSSSVPCVGSGTSSFYIFKDNQYNSITGTSNIFVNLPYYLDYSFDYSNMGEDLDIDLFYNVDNEYISDIVDNQITLPNNTDFNNIITGILPLFVPGLIIILFIYFVFKLLKKIF